MKKRILLLILALMFVLAGCNIGNSKEYNGAVEAFEDTKESYKNMIASLTDAVYSNSQSDMYLTMTYQTDTIRNWSTTLDYYNSMDSDDKEKFKEYLLDDYSEVADDFYNSLTGGDLPTYITDSYINYNE